MRNYSTLVVSESRKPRPGQTSPRTFWRPSRRSYPLSLKNLPTCELAATGSGHSADNLPVYREEKLQVLPSGAIAWSLLWLLFEVGQQVEIVYELTGEKVSLSNGATAQTSAHTTTFGRVDGDAGRRMGLRNVPKRTDVQLARPRFSVDGS